MECKTAHICLHATQRRFKLRASYATKPSIHERFALMKRLFDIISGSLLVILFDFSTALTALAVKLTSTLSLCALNIATGPFTAKPLSAIPAVNSLPFCKSRLLVPASATDSHHPRQSLRAQNSGSPRVSPTTSASPVSLRTHLLVLDQQIKIRFAKIEREVIARG